MCRQIVVAMCILITLFATVAFGETWDLALGYSATQNPNGAWAFGWRTTLIQMLTLYTDNGPEPLYGCDVEGWRYDIDSGCPWVGHNPHDYDYQCGPLSLVFPANSIWFHPGPAQQSVVRWTAPVSAQIQIDAHFRMLDTGTAVVHLYANGTEVFTAPLSYLGDSVVYSATIGVLEGNQIDIAVSPVSFNFSSIQLNVVYVTVGPVVAEERSWGDVKHLFKQAD